MRILQMSPHINYGDAIGNDMLAMKRILTEEGFESEIYVEVIDSPRVADQAKIWDQMPAVNKRDVVIYHGSTGSLLAEKFQKLRCRKILCYHNITPPAFFHEVDPEAEAGTIRGLEEIKALAHHVDYAFADSSFNGQDLKRMGYTCDIDVCPLILSFDDFIQTPPDEELMQKYSGDGITNLFFAGRVTPNKKQEDLLRLFYYYHNYYNPQSRLILAGMFRPVYQAKLAAYAAELNLTDHVIFTDHIPFEQLLAWYHLADAFVCMSEHEGFCVPLLEAMTMKLPVIAYGCTAIPETLGGAGILLPDKNPKAAARIVNRVLTDDVFRADILAGEERRLADFSYDKTREQFVSLIRRFLEREGLTA